MKRYNILFVHGGSDNIAGQEIALLNTIKSLKRFGLQMSVALPGKGRFDNLLAEDDIKTYHLELNKFRLRSSFLYLKTVYLICRLILKEKISIIHCSGASPVQYCLPAARMAGIPCISHIHTAAYSKDEITESLVRFSDCIIAVSNAVKTMLNEFNCPSYKTKTIYCGVASNGASANITASQSIRQMFNIPPNFKIVGQVSQLIPRKGLEDFIDMARVVKDVYKDVKFIIVGDPIPEHPEYKEYLSKKINRLKLSDDIIFTGFQRDVHKFISLFDVAVLASHGEGLPLALVESMNLGKPVIATPVGGIPEIIIDGKTGLLVPPHDPASLSRAVIKILDNPEDAKLLAEDGKAFVFEKFSMEAHANSLLNIYTLLLN